MGELPRPVRENPYSVRGAVPGSAMDHSDFNRRRLLRALAHCDTDIGDVIRLRHCRGNAGILAAILVKRSSDKSRESWSLVSQHVLPEQIGNEDEECQRDSARESLARRGKGLRLQHDTTIAPDRAYAEHSLPYT